MKQAGYKVSGQHQTVLAVSLGEFRTSGYPVRRKGTGELACRSYSKEARIGWRPTFDIRSQAGGLVQVGGDKCFTDERGGVTLHIRGQIRVNILRVGRIVEKLIAAEVEKRYAAVAIELQRYIDNSTEETTPAPAA